MSAAWKRGWRKAARTAVQLLVSGALTTAVNTLAEGLSPNLKVYVLAGLTVLTALAQNAAETAALIPTLLPTPGLLPTTGVVAPAVGLVEAGADSETGEVTGTVTDTAGSVVGEVVGQLGYVDHEEGEKGGAGLIALGIIAFFVIMAVGGFATCDLMFDDESEDGDQHLLGRIELVSR